MAKKDTNKKNISSKTDLILSLEKSKWFAPIAFIIIFIALLGLFSDFVFSDDMLKGSDTINAGLYFRSFLVDHVLEYGSVPQWNPYIWGGMPFVEAFHGDIFYPLSFLKYFGDIKRSLGWILFWHIFLAGLFMYFTAREFKLSKIASLFSAVVYMFAPYLVSFVAPGHDGKIFVTALYPLTFLFLNRGFDRKPLLNFSLMGVVIGFIILSPHPQMSYFVLLSLAFYTIYKLVFLFKEKKSFPAVVTKGSFTLYAVIIGLGISAIQFYPGYLYTSNFSPRSETKKGWDWATSWSMHEEEAASIVIPEFCGTATAKAETYYWGKNVFKDNSESVGAIACFICLIGLFFVRSRESYFFLGLGLFALSYALASTTPLFKIYFYLIPKVDSMRAASMIMFIGSFSIALIGGMGIQYIRDRINESDKQIKWFNYLLFGFPGILLLFALLFSAAGSKMLSIWNFLFYADAASIEIQQGFTKYDLAIRNLPAIQTGFWFAFLFTAIAAVMIWMYRNQKFGLMALVVVVLLPVVDGMRFNARFIESFNNSQYEQKFGENQLIRMLKSKPDKFRVMNALADQDNTLPYHGIDIPTGYHGNQLRWYDNLVGDVSRSYRFKPGFLNLMGAKYIILPANQQLPQGYLGSKPVEAEANLGQAVLFRNDNALPRVFFANNYEVASDRTEIYPTVVNMTDSLKDKVYLEEEPEISISSDELLDESVTITQYTSDSINIALKCNSNRLLVLTDTYFDAWKAFIDGQEAKVLRAYGAVRAVAIPSGSKELVFRYESERYKTGKLVTSITIFYLLAVFGVYLLQSRRKKEV